MSARFAQCTECHKYVPISSNYCMHCGGGVISKWGSCSGPAEFSKLQGDALENRVRVLESGIQVALQYLRIDNFLSKGIASAREQLERALHGRF